MQLVTVLRVVGGAMALVAIVWASIIGFYPSQVPVLIVLGLGGAALLATGEALKDRAQP
ncbi:hypothetical protein [Cellulomonas sp. KRMCY2]|uniref:hypothetical protein n=1 Tax=Cellulomonas sp. KRMCY2 TaxID=1304865 RepID=UPI0004BCAEE7|nr:hypothetical protein [Cellulomonas sp. KRMCY2]